MMKGQVKGILIGSISAICVMGVATTALAATGAVSFNHSPIQFNGQQISAAGEDYTLDNGCMAPSSITYTDEKGGGTTYLPARRIAELMGVGIGYDAATGAVTVSGEVAPAPATTPAPDTTASAADYSDWTAEEEAAYQEFKGLWEVDKTATLKTPMSRDELCQWFLDRSPEIEKIAIRFAKEFGTYSEAGDLWMYFHSGEDGARYSAVVTIAFFEVEKFSILS